jgi:hypothetical protein
MGTSDVSRAAIGSVALLLAVVVSGCEEDEPSTSPPPSSSPSEPESSAPSEPATSATTDPAEPTLPPEAQARSRAGARAFVAYYWDVVNYATFTGDVALLKRLDQPSCVGCAGGVRFLERVYASGGRMVGGGYRVVQTDAAQSPSGDWAITTHTEVGLQRVVGAGDLNERYPAGRGKWLMALTWFDGSWSVATLEGL